MSHNKSEKVSKQYSTDYKLALCNLLAMFYVGDKLMMLRQLDGVKEEQEKYTFCRDPESADTILHAILSHIITYKLQLDEFNSELLYWLASELKLSECANKLSATPLKMVEKPGMYKFKRAMLGELPKSISQKKSPWDDSFVDERLKNLVLNKQQKHKLYELAIANCKDQKLFLKIENYCEQKITAQQQRKTIIEAVTVGNYDLLYFFSLRYKNLYYSSFKSGSVKEAAILLEHAAKKAKNPIDFSFVMSFCPTRDNETKACIQNALVAAVHYWNEPVVEYLLRKNKTDTFLSLNFMITDVDMFLPCSSEKHHISCMASINHIRILLAKELPNHKDLKPWPENNSTTYEKLLSKVPSISDTYTSSSSNSDSYESENDEYYGSSFLPQAISPVVKKKFNRSSMQDLPNSPQLEMSETFSSRSTRAPS